MNLMTKRNLVAIVIVALGANIVVVQEPPAAEIRSGEHHKRQVISREALRFGSRDLPVALDINGSVSQRFQVDAIPQTVIIGPEGRIKRVFVGAPAGLHDGIEQAIRDILEEGGLDE